jgi:hypothetical protein
MKRIPLDGGDKASLGFLFSAYHFIIPQLTKRTRSEIQEGDTQFVRSTKGSAEEAYRIGNEMFKQNLGIQSLLMQFEEKQLHLLDTIKRMANIRMLRSILGLKFKGNRPIEEVNIYGNKSFSLV